MGTDRAVRVRTSSLARLVEDGRVVQDRWVVGSDCVQAKGMRREWEEAGYAVGKWRANGPEVEVDDALQSRMLESVTKTHSPSRTMVLLSGDGNTNYGKGTIPQCAEVALRNGWKVEVWSWMNATNKRYRTLQIRYPNQFALRWFDAHREAFTYNLQTAISIPDK